MQRRFVHQLDEESEHNSKLLALWLSLDALTGEVKLYPRSAATRLEAAHVNHRSSVPLAGLGDALEDSIVFLSKKGVNEHPVQKSLAGAQADVRRIEIRAGASEVCINVVRDGVWHIADVAIPGKTEQRHLNLNGTEMVRPPTPPLPPLDPDRRLYFCNRTAESDYY